MRNSRRRAALWLLLVVLLSAGCAASRSAAAPAAPTSAKPSAAAQNASADPPAAARMVCSDEIRRQVTGALGLSSVATPQSSWADHVYTCTYSLPMGTLVLSVTVAPSNSAARSRLDQLRAQFGASDAEPGLGEQAYSNPDGRILAVKDNMVLDVDATALPDDLGVVHERRIDLARILAAGVFSCWTGEG